MSWWRFFARRRRDLDEEIEAHLRMAVRDRVERGETLAEARAAAAKEFGNVPLVKDVTRKTWGWEWLESAVQDLKYALRRLVKSPGFTHCGNCHAGAGHRREHGDLRASGCRAVAVATGGESAGTGGGAGCRYG